MQVGVTKFLTCNVFNSSEKFFGVAATKGSKREVVRRHAQELSGALDRVSVLPGATKLKKVSATAEAVNSILNWKMFKKTLATAKKEFEAAFGTGTMDELGTVVVALLAGAIPDRAWKSYGALEVAQIWGVTLAYCDEFQEHDHSKVQNDVFFGWGALTPEGKRELTEYFIREYGRSTTWLSSSNRGSYIESFTLEMRENVLTDYVPPEGQQSDIEGVKKELSMFRAAGLSRNVLLLGRPGVGKTALATHIAAGTGGICFVLKGRQEHTTIAAVFAGILNGVTIVFDDVDRDAYSIKEFISAGGPLPEGSCVIATANALHTLDPAMMRPGRFDRVLVVETASASWLRKIIGFYARPLGLFLTDAEHEALSVLTPAEAKDVVRIMGVVDRGLMVQEVARVIAQREFIDLSLIKKDDKVFDLGVEATPPPSNF